MNKLHIPTVNASSLFYFLYKLLVMISRIEQYKSHKICTDSTFKSNEVYIIMCKISIL